ncbi:hypothetical protein [Saccharothrix variisporea]|uniref:hypothetical protein n=1 Tax=Saccharothrix variisporea TaxID=543527 RepID=UPI000EB213FD|nr:hypothetical protein [Saccharothrix variisporea]
MSTNATGSPDETTDDSREDPAGGPTEDELDKEQLDQLHAATLKASETCFELKKLCATVLVPAATLVALLSDRTLNPAVFGAGVVVVAAFWAADSVAYFYQRKLRNAMAVIWQRRARRVPGYGHVPGVVPITAARAVFNSSMVYYFVLLGLVALLFVLYAAGAIQPVSPSKP